VPHVRYLCKQLRARFPSLPLVVGCWGASEPVAETVALLRADGLDHIGTTLQTTRDPRAFITMQKELALHSLSDQPPAWSQFWFGSHPTTLVRIAIAEQLGGTAQPGRQP